MNNTEIETSREATYHEQLERQQFLNDEEKAALFFRCLVSGDAQCARMLDRYEVLLWIMTSTKKGIPDAKEAFRFSRRKIRNSSKARAYAATLGLELYDAPEATR